MDSFFVVLATLWSGVRCVAEMQTQVTNHSCELKTYSFFFFYCTQMAFNTEHLLLIWPLTFYQHQIYWKRSNTPRLGKAHTFHHFNIHFIWPSFHSYIKSPKQDGHWINFYKSNQCFSRTPQLDLSCEHVWAPLCVHHVHVNVWAFYRKSWAMVP